MTELLVGTKKGLFVLEGEPGRPFQITARAFAGEPVDYAVRDQRSGRLLATMTSPFYGPKIFYTDDPAGDWQQAEGVALPEGGDQALTRIWVITPGQADGVVYAGGDPGVLFESFDGGATWSVNQGLWSQPTRPKWQPGGGGLCLHSIAPWPGDPDRLTVAISAAGVWHSDDGGRSWRRANHGLTPRYLPDEVIEQLQLPEPPPDADVGLCVHHLERAPQRPERLFMQFHGGVYRSDDAGETWTEIGQGLPSDFGFPLAVDPADPDSAYVIPLVADMDRVTPEGRVRVFETRDAGASWSPRGQGLPDHDAYLTVLRQAFTGTGEGPGLELYFGSTTGQLFASPDAGETWSTVASLLPPVHALTAA
ncbi:MAG TPA: sialidase family protein [Solirubrobacteraceae bacterium]|nr:sialidase family protein [Solirubrobacteraceae bacterium]